MGAPDGSGRTPVVSVVIPVYNALPHLRQCLDSVLAQDLPPDAVEVVAVDDGSTDGSGDVLDEYARLDRRVRVVHQENSGWPGRPRNVGTDLSRGTFVFYMDSDDYLGREALRRATSFAERHGSDVVVVKLVGVDGRWQGRRAWRDPVQVDADLTKVFLTLSPQKLFRRAFLTEAGLRFPEGKVRLEDGMFVARAYVRATRVSLLANYDYYFLRQRPEGGNISAQPLPPAGYIGSVTAITDTIRELPDAAVADAIALDLYRRKALKVFVPKRFLGYSTDRRREWYWAVHQLATTRLPESLDASLPYPQALRSAVVRTGDPEAMTRLATRELAGHVRGRLDGTRVLVDLPDVVPDGTATAVDVTPTVRLEAHVESVRGAPGGLRIAGTAALADLPTDPVALTVVLADRSTGDERTLAAAADGSAPDGRWPFAVHLPADVLLSAGPEGVWDLSVEAGLEGRPRARLAVPPSQRAALDRRAPRCVSRRRRLHAVAYVTVRGNLSVRVADAAEEPTVASRSRRRLTRALVRLLKRAYHRLPVRPA